MPFSVRCRGLIEVAAVVIIVGCFVSRILLLGWETVGVVRPLPIDICGSFHELLVFGEITFVDCPERILIIVETIDALDRAGLVPERFREREPKDMICGVGGVRPARGACVTGHISEGAVACACDFSVFGFL